MLTLILSIVIFLFVMMILVIGISVGASSGSYAEESDDDRMGDDDRMQRAMSMIAIAPLYREDPEQWRRLAESITGKKFDK